MEGLSSLGMGLFSRMVDSWRKEQFCDVTIKCSNLCKIKAPSILLGTISGKLSDILSQCCDNILTTSDISIHMWKALLTIIYNGNIYCLLEGEDTTPTVRDIRQFAECLDIHSVVDMCEQEIKKDGELANQAQRYRYVRTSPMEFNLMFFMETEEGKERVTSTCECVYNDPEFNPLKIEVVSLSEVDSKELVGVIKKSPQKIKKEEMDDPGLVTPKLEPAEESSGRRRTRGVRKTYTPYGIKQEDEEENETTEDDVVVYDDDSDEFVPEEMDEDEQVEDFTITEDGEEPSTSNSQPMRIQIPAAKKFASTTPKPSKQATPRSARKVEVEIKINPSDAVFSKKVKVCFQCHSKCRAEFVQCRLCFQVVDGSSLKHVEDEHPLLNNVIWPVNCDIDELKHEEETVMIGRSTVGNIDGKNELGMVFQCMECIEMFVSQDEFDQHIRDHSFAVFSCQQDSCHFSFKLEAFRMEHQHFCSGGSLLKCYSCHKILGGMLGYNKHKCNKKMGDKQVEKKSKAQSKAPPSSYRNIAPKPPGWKPVTEKPSPKKKPTQVKTPRKSKVTSITRPNYFALKKISSDKTRPYISEKLEKQRVELKEIDIKNKIGVVLLPLGGGDDIQNIGHLRKCCKTCGFHCNADVVQCLYCGVLVQSTDEELHVLSEHSGTPKDRLWPVNCSDLPEESESSVVCKYQGGAVSLLSGLAVTNLQPVQDSNQGDASESATKENESNTNQANQNPNNKNILVLTPAVVAVESENANIKATCCLCDYTCTSRIELNNHMSKKHQRSVLYCQTCPDGFDDVNVYENHSYYCSGKHMLTCVRCGLQIVGNEIEAKQHEDEKHSVIDIGKMYRELIRDVNEESGEWIQRCFYCGEDGCDEALVKCILCWEIVPNNEKHMEEHPLTPKTSVWPVSCKFNKYMNHLPSLAGRGVLTTNGENGKEIEITCSQCDFSDKAYDVVASHIKAKHQLKYVRQCDTCHMLFNKYEAWRDHDHFCNGGDLMVCAICCALCGGLKAMNDHICRNHPEAKGLPGINERGPRRWSRRYTAKPHKPLNSDSIFKPAFDRVRDENRAQYCFVCGKNGCNEDKVKCIYCQEIVVNDKIHMAQHPFISSYSPWGVTCDLSDLPDGKKKFVLSERVYSRRLNRKRILVCYMCDDFVSNGSKEMMDHLEKAHKIEERIHRCKHCCTVMSNYDFAKDHEHYCGGGDLIKCQCGDVCGGFKYLIDHITENHIEGANSKTTEPATMQADDLVLSNPILKEYFNEEESNYDEESDENTYQRKQDCFICEGKCIKERMHLQVRVKCLLCYNLVKNSPEHMLQKHVHTPPDVAWPITCGPYKRAYNAVVVERSAIVHPTDGLTRLECNLCSFNAPTGSHKEFVEHFADIHKSTVYFCQVCEQGFKSSQMMKDHERLCGGHGFPVCNFCGRRCSCYEALIEHIKSAHQKGKRKKEEAKDDEAACEEDDEGKVVKKRKKFNTKQLTVANFDASKEEPDENGYVKICAFCGTTCISHVARCLLCFKVVPPNTDHMVKEHPFSPSKSWIVNCQNTNSHRGGTKKKNGKLVALNMEYFLVGRANSVGLVVDEKGQKSLAPEESERVALDIQCTLDHKHATEAIPNLGAFINHLKAQHADVPTRLLQLCRHCNLIFCLHDNVSKFNFADHEYFCAGNGLYYCRICKLHFQSCRKNNSHMMTHHKDLIPETNKPKSTDPPVVVPEGYFIQCNDCEYQARSFNDYSQHVRSVHQYKKTQVQVCAYCFKAFMVCSKRELHEQQQHLGGGSFPCEVCGREFSTPTSLRTHIKYYHEGGRIKQKIYRDNKTKIPCSYCGKLFQLGIHVQQHERAAHLNQKRYQCRVCGARFTNHSACRTHEDRHTGVKRYKCPYCDYRAYKGSRVNEHIKTKHPGKKRAFGWDQVRYDGDMVQTKGDEFIVEGTHSYKPRLKREEFDFGDYEESYEPGLAMERPAYRNTKSGQELYITSLPNNANIDIKMVPKAEEVPMYLIKGADGNETNEIYMTEEELRAVLVGTNKKVEYVIGDETAGKNADQQVQYVLNPSATSSASSIKQEIEYVVEPSNSASEIVSGDVQYVLGTGDDTKEIQYVIDTDNVNDEAKQEVELIINSAVAGGSGSSSTNRTLLKSFLSGTQGDSGVVSDATGKEQVYYIVPS